MLKIENFEVLGWEHAIRGMRNPKNSWEKSDSGWDARIPPLELRNKVDWDEYAKQYITAQYSDEYEYDIGPNDQKLLESLAAGGPVHAKYRRMITVYLDITAPLYWWKEFDTYKVGTVANSCSTMHKIHEKEFTLEDFSTEYLAPLPKLHFEGTINALNLYRDMFVRWDEIDDNTKNACLIHDKKEAWYQMIQLLPSSYNQKRTVMLNYEVLANIYRWRRDHKLDEWHTFCDWIERLPYSELITGVAK